MTCSDLENQSYLLALSLFIAVTELDASNFCIIKRVAMVVEMFFDRETRHVLSNTEVLAKAFPHGMYGFAYIEGLAATTGDAVGQIRTVACEGLFFLLSSWDLAN